MPHVTYTGPAPAVDIAVPGGSVHAERGVPVEVSADLAERLLEQDTFKAAKAAPEAVKAASKEND